MKPNGQTWMEVCVGCVIKAYADEKKLGDWWTRICSKERKNHSCKGCDGAYIREATRIGSETGDPPSRSKYWHGKAGEALDLLRAKIEEGQGRWDNIRKAAIEDLNLKKRVEDRRVFEGMVSSRVRTLYEPDDVEFYYFHKKLVATVHHIEIYITGLEENLAEEERREQAVATA